MWTYSRGMALNAVRRTAMLLLALPIIGTVAAPLAQAQTTDVPLVITPLRVEGDRNGVNLVNGKTIVDLPSISVPAAPRLRFMRGQDVAPFVDGAVPIGDPDTVVATYSVHTGGLTSESFKCLHSIECESVTKSGSTLTEIPNGRLFVEAGTGVRYKFNLAHVIITATNRKLKYYASSIEYPDGEKISFQYETYTTIVGTITRTFYRPKTISSNTGYSMSIAYSSDVSPSTGWDQPKSVAIYADSAPTVILASASYTGATTITDIGGRVYTCTGCSRGLSIDEEVFSGSMKLPGETTTAMQFNTLTGYQLIGSASKDGVNWTYSYTNPVYYSGLQSTLYDKITVTGPDGSSDQFIMGQAQGRNYIQSWIDRSGRTTGYEYDAGYRPVRVTYPEGNEARIAYDVHGNIVEKRTVAKAGSGLSDLVESAQVDAGCGTTGIGSTSANVLCFRLAWTRDALNRQTDYTYNSLGQLIQQLDPADASGVRRKTIIEYEAFNTGAGTLSRKKVVRVCGDTTTCGTTAEQRTEYDYWGSTFLPSAVRQVDQSSSQTRETMTSYDSAGRIVSIDGPRAGSDDTQYFRYDVFGRKTWEIGPLAPNGLRIARRFTYRNSDDKVVSVESGTVPSATSTTLTVLELVSTSYDSRRNAIRETVSAGGQTQRVTDSSYLDNGLVECVTQRMNPAVFASLPASACTLSTAGSFGSDRVTRNVYDAAGRLLQIRRAVGTPLEQAYATYSYTANGKQEYVIDARGNRAKLEYDGVDRQLKWIFPSATAPAAYNGATQATALATAGSVNATDYEQYGYDAASNRTSFRKRDGSTLTYIFDALNRVTRKTVPERSGLAATHTRDVFYGYDPRGLQTYARFDSATGQGITNVYDGFGGLTSTTTNMDAVTRALSYQYDLAGNRTRITYPDNNYVTYEYDALNRPTAIKRSGSATVAAYTYDNAGRRATFTGGVDTSYAYDGIGRLTTLTNTPAGATGSGGSYGFAYNPASQMTQLTRSNDAFAFTARVNVNRNYTVNGLNQYGMAAAQSFTYDANGNLTGDNTSTFVYDIENRLVQASGGATGTLRYDPLGRLYEVTGGVSGTVRFLYDGDALAAEYGGTGTLLRRYAHGADVKADDPIAWYEGAAFGASNERIMRPDWQGSIVLVTDSTGATILATNRYDEYGIPQPANGGRFQYTGQAWLPDLGMYHYKARIYSPTLGRFLQTDPIGYDDQINLYTYVNNDPMNNVDPTGLCTGSRIERKDGQCVGGGTIGGGSVGSCDGRCGPSISARRAITSSSRRAGSGTPQNGDDIIDTATIPTPPSNLPGGPYTAKPPSPGNRPGSFLGPRQPKGPRPQAQWVPPEATGGPPGSKGYWKTQLPGEQGWNRYNQSGQPLTSDQAHPNPGSTRSFFFLGPVGAFLCALFCESPAY